MHCLLRRPHPNREGRRRIELKDETLWRHARMDGGDKGIRGHLLQHVPGQFGQQGVGQDVIHIARARVHLGTAGNDGFHQVFGVSESDLAENRDMSRW